jgi:hypothetical protein
VSTSATRNLTLALDEFGRTSLEGQARALDVPAAAIVSQAALYFLAELGRERAATKVPRFAREAAPGGERLELTVALDPTDWRALEREAELQHVTLERLLVHAALLLLADLDSGRVAVRILEEEEEEEED